MQVIFTEHQKAAHAFPRSPRRVKGVWRRCMQTFAFAHRQQMLSEQPLIAPKVCVAPHK
jgi:hypothetical protein